jgi:WD40 repeat protein/serine/threonine protein kinase
MDDISGQSIRGYRLLERIGIGGFGSVYRAHQAVIDRDVAIKIIRPDFANNPDFVRRFEAEAQMVARLEHIHIVPLYDYWREPNSAYLVMRWLRHGSLRDRLMTAGLLSLDTVSQAITHIGAALAFVHRNGIVHQDIKPENILFDEDDNAYITDFGIATLRMRSTDEDRKRSFGTPAYMSPEAILRESITPQSDLYSLGILLYEMLTGRPPYGGATDREVMEKQVNDPMPSLHIFRPDLPEELNVVLWKATAKSPSARYPDVASFIEDYREHVYRQQPILVQVPLTPPTALPESHDTPPLGYTIDFSELTEPDNPYKGLRAFEESDALDFFGRGALIQDILARLRNSPSNGRFLVIVGPSGSGKSSLVKAGVIPILRKGALPGSASWFYATMTPGMHPLTELKEAILRLATETPPTFFDLADQDDRRLLQVADDILPDNKSELILTIDQFEEVFTLVSNEAERTYFLNLLARAATTPQSRLRIIITLRADFYDRPLLYAEFGNLLRDHTQVVLPLNNQELEEAIIKPAQRVGLTLESGLVATIVAEVNRQPGALPLLQYTLTELYQKRVGKLLSLEAYKASGGVLSSLAKRADQLYGEMDAAHQKAARQIFLRLVAFDEGIEATRQRMLLSEILSLGEDREVIQQTLDLFGKYRLLTFDREATSREPTVEVAHEALIQEWALLKTWIEESREDLRIQRRLSASTREWLNSSQDTSFLASGSRLAQFESLATRADIVLNEHEKAYVQSSIRLRERNLNRLRMFIAVLIGLVLVAVGLAIFAFNRQNQALAERDRADQQARIARSRELSVTSLTNGDRLDLSLLLSLEALNIADTFEARSSLLTALQAEPHLLAWLAGHTDGVRTVAFSPDGRTIASGGRDNTVILWDTQTHAAIGSPLTGHEGWINALAFSPDGRLVASASSDGTVRLWNVQTGEAVGQPLVGHQGAVWSLDFSMDNKTLASGSDDRNIILWDMETQTAIQTLEGHTDTVYSLRFSPADPSLLASGSADGTVRLWNTEAGEAYTDPLIAHTNWVMDLAFHPDGRLLASSGVDGSIAVWDTRFGQLLFQFQTNHTDWVRSLSFSFDGRLLASGSADRSVRFWDVETGQQIESPLTGHLDAVWSVAFSPNDLRLVSGGLDRNVLLWNMGNRTLVENTLMGHEADVTDLAITGNLLVSASGDPSVVDADHTIRLWDLETGEQRQILPGHNGIATSVAISPDGKIIASSGADRTVRLWDAASGEPIGDPLIGHQDVAWSVAFSPDGKTIASGSDDRTIILWDFATQAPRTTLTGHENGILTIAYHPKGKWLASGSRNGNIILWDTQTGQPVGEPMIGHIDAVTKVLFSPDGRILASASRDGSVILWDPATRQPLGNPLTGHTNWVLDLAFNPDGTWLASSSRDGTVILWDIKTRRLLGTPFVGHRDWVGSLSFNEDGSRLISGSNDGIILLWDVSLPSWRQHACQLANRSLSPAEWNRFFPDTPYHLTCS